MNEVLYKYRNAEPYSTATLCRRPQRRQTVQLYPVPPTSPLQHPASSPSQSQQPQQHVRVEINGVVSYCREPLPPSSSTPSPRCPVVVDVDDALHGGGDGGGGLGARRPGLMASQRQVSEGDAIVRRAGAGLYQPPYDTYPSAPAALTSRGVLKQTASDGAVIDGVSSLPTAANKSRMQVSCVVCFSSYPISNDFLESVFQCTTS